MKRLKILLWYKQCVFLSAIVLLLSFIGSGCSRINKEEKIIKPPVAEKIKKELTIHGDTRIDNYYWLNERENSKVIEYLKAENEYKEAVMKHTETLQENLYNEIVGRIKQTDMSVPFKTEGYYYYSRFEEGKEYPVYCRKKESLETEEEILLNVNEMAEGYGFYHVAGLTVSTNNNLIAFGVDTVSRRRYTIHFKDLTTGEILPDEIPNTAGQAAWANDNKTVFYSIKDDSLRSYKIFKHILGSEVSADKEIFHEKDVTFSTYVYKCKSKKYLFIASDSTLSTEYQYLDANSPDGKFKIIQPRERDLEYRFL